MNMPPLFSVIIPAYNEDKYLDRTLKSIQAQDCTDYEIVIVTNGCTDRTEEIAREHKSENIRVLSLPKPNVSVARNAGALNAQGKILVFLDADTRLGENSLNIINEQFTPEYSIATTKVRPDEKKIKYRMTMSGKNILTTTGLYKGFGGIVICRKELFHQENGYNPTIVVKEHHDLRRKLERHGKYRCVNAYVTTSMRRFSKWGFLRTAGFWVKQWAKHYTGRKLDEQYEKIR